MNRHRHLIRNMVVMGGAPKYPCLYGGVNFDIDIGSDAAIDDLTDGAMTLEGWYRFYLEGQNQVLFSKGVHNTNGFEVYCHSSGVLRIAINLQVIGPLQVDTAINIANNTWNHIAVTWDDAGDRKSRTFLNGVLVATSGTNANAIASDAASTGRLGNSEGGYHLLGRSAIGWVRWSNSKRYIDAGGWTPPPRSIPPTLPDANTVGQWNFTEMTGTVIDNAEGTATRDGNITGAYRWAMS